LSLSKVKMEALWIIIVVAAVLFLFVIFKMRHSRHRLSNFLMLFGFIFLLVGAYLLYVFVQEPAKMPEIANSTRLFFAWMINAAKNIGQITGYAIHQNWTVNALNSTATA
jgi:hypothetical protein